MKIQFFVKSLVIIALFLLVLPFPTSFAFTDEFAILSSQSLFTIGNFTFDEIKSQHL